MATISWTNSAGGDWFHKANWDLHRNPQKTDDVVIATGGAYTVSLGASYNVNSITISNPTATLVIDTPLGKADIINSGILTFVAETHTGTITNTGTINESGNTSFEDHFSNTGTLSVHGALDLVADAPSDLFTQGSLIVSSGRLVFAQAGTISSLGSGMTVVLERGGEIDTNVSGTFTNVFENLSSNYGTISLVNSGTGSSAATFANHGDFLIDATSGEGGTTGFLNPSLSNSGTLVIGNTNLSAAESWTTDSLTNSGFIDLIGSASDQAALVDFETAPATLSEGSFDLSGNTLLQFRSGRISDIATGAALSIDGSHAFVASHGKVTENSALVSLTDNAGTLTLGDGVVLGNAAVAFTNSGTYTAFDHTQVKTSLDFTNSGQLNIDAGAGQGGSSLSVTGTFSNGGTFDFGNASLSAADLSVVTNLDNTGTIDIAGSSASDSATLKVKGDATNSGTVEIAEFGALTKAHGYTQTAGETDLAGAINLPDTFIQGGILQGIGKDTGSVVVTGGGIAGGDFASATLGTLSIKGKLVDSAEVDATLVAAGSGAASEIDVTGSKVSLKDGTLHLNITDPANLHAGETFTVLTFTPDILTFGFSAMTDGTHSGDGNSLDLGNGFTLDASYNNAQGNIQLTVVDTPAHATEPVSDDFGANTFSMPDAQGTHHGHGDDWLS